MKKIGSLLLAGVLGLNLAAVGMSHAAPTAASAAGSCVVEHLDRGICAINTGSGMLVTWRFLPVIRMMQYSAFTGAAIWCTPAMQEMPQAIWTRAAVPVIPTG